MPSTVNSRFLSIGTPEPNISTGWQIRVLDYKDMKSLVAIVGEYTAFSFTQELNGPGQGSITLDYDSPFWTDILSNGNSRRVLLNNEYVFEAWDNGVPRFAWLAQTVTQTVTGDDGTHGITIAGPGIAQALTWAIINRPGWPTKPPIIGHQTSTDGSNTVINIWRSTSQNDTQPAFLWRFPIDWPTMRMWYTVFKAAQRRGVVPFVTLMFTALKDSGKQDFQVVKTIEEVATNTGYQPQEPGQNLLEFLNDCTGRDYSKWFGQRLEWLMYPGFKLDVRRRIGTDRSKTVRFFSGNIISDERVRDRETIYNRVIAVDVDGDESIRLDTRSVAAWNIREQRNETNKNVTDTKLRDQIADRYIQQSKDQKDQWTIKVAYDEPGRVPYRNYFVGDDVGVNDDTFGSTPTAAGPPTKYRVMAITVSLASDQTVPDCELTLQSLIDAKLLELEKQITQLINNPRNYSLADLKEIAIPGTPADGSTLVYNATTGKWEPGDPATGSGGGTGGPRVFVQSVDPATQSNVTVSPGDFWLETYD